MREILFRGKVKNTNEWQYGDLRHWTKKSVGIHHQELHTTLRVIPETVGQYTGLKDKNGKKIFEGDIVDASNEWWDACGSAGHDSPIIKVEWSEEHCGFDPFANYDSDCGVYINASGCEVIGNIHDNPELLKGGENG
jgi:uncharacterized phage protein (TIGR01671 family)